MLYEVITRDAGFIAGYAALADTDVNYCLIPEQPFRLEKLLKALQERILHRGHAVIVVASSTSNFRSMNASIDSSSCFRNNFV